MKNIQYSMFGNETISALLDEINSRHKAFYYLIEKEQEYSYSVYRYGDGDILLCVYRKNCTDECVNEKIIAKSVYLGKTNNGTYIVRNFNSDCLEGLVDCRSKHILLDCFVNKTELIDDLGE